MDNVVADMNKILLVIIFSFAQGLVSIVQAQQWFYVDPIKPFDSFSIQNNPSLFGVNDVLLDATICDKKDEYICIEAPDFSFHVPKNISISLKEWRINKKEYKSQLSKQLQIFGIKDKVFLIDRIEGKNTIRFLFSKKRGLIGIGGFSGNSTGLFLVNTYCGFGASENCVETIR